MDNTVDLRWQAAATGGSQAHRAPPPWSDHALRAWCGALRFLRRRHVWPVLAALVAGCGLLLAFQQVLLMAVQQGEARQRATATHVDSVWRCNALSNRAQRTRCLTQIDVANPQGVKHEIVSQSN